MESTEAFFFKNRDEWRGWLEKNHEREKEAWLIHHKKKSGGEGIGYK